MKRTILLILSIFIINLGYSQLSGEYTIDPDQPYAGTNFQSFDVAIMVLNSQGISGPVTFKVKPGVVFKENIRTITRTGTITNTITFIKNGEGQNPKIMPNGGIASNNSGISMNEVSYITFDGIDIESEDDSVEYGYYISTGSDNPTNNINIKNCTIILNKNDSLSYGIRFLSLLANAGVQVQNNNLIQNVTISNSFYGIGFNGSLNSYGKNNRILDCIIDNIGRETYTSTKSPVYGIVFENQSNFQIENSTISNLTGNGFVNGVYTSQGDTNTYTINNCTISNIYSKGASSSNAAGLYLNRGKGFTVNDCILYNINCYVGTATNSQGIYANNITDSLIISNNKVYDIYSPATGGSGYANGINVTGTGKKYIYNNMVAGISAPASSNAAAVCGLKAGGAANAYFWHNTVYLNYTPTSSGSSAAIYIGVGSSNTTEMINNIYINASNYSTNGTRCAAFIKTSAAVISTTSNMNIYYAGIPSSKNLIAYLGSTAYQTLEAFKAAVTYDQNSYTELTPFDNYNTPYELHILSTQCSYANDNGLPISMVTTDYDGNIRNTTTPDIGADEQTGYSLVANAGIDSTICSNSIQLYANDPSIQGATGIWTINSGGGTIINNLNYQTSVTSIPLGTNSYTWTLSKTACKNVSDTVVIINASVVANAGIDTMICSNSIQLYANDPSPATGTWSVAGGSGTFTNNLLFNTSVTNIGNGQNIFTWTVSNPNCSENDNIIITNNSVYANAGIDTMICSNSIQLYANDPSIQSATGTWSVVSGSASILNNLYHSSNVVGIGAGSNTLGWTVSNGFCSDTDFVVITFEEINAEFNVSQIVGNTVTLNNNSSQSATTFYWEFGDGNDLTQNSYTSTVDHTYSNSNTYTVSLTVTGQKCSDVFDSQITITTVDIINSNVQIFPNPVSSILYIKNSETIESIKIIDIQGKVIKQKVINNQDCHIQVNELAKGIYFIEVNTSNKKEYFKIIKR